MAVQPFLPEGMPVGLVQFIYSIIFFTVAARIALHPERLTEYLGKRLTPILLTLIVIIFVVSLIHPTGSAAAPVGMYASAPVIHGFQYGYPAAQGVLDGYQTMDALAALTFGTVIALNIREQGITEEKAVVKETISAGWIAGGCLILVYAMLNYVGMLAGGAFTGMENGTDVLLLTVHTLFGNAGTIVLALVFLIACFNTCVSLLSCCGKYFNELFPQISFPHWVFLFAGLSMLISNVGLNTILKISGVKCHLSTSIAADLLNLHKQVDQKISEDLSLVCVPLLRKQYHAHAGAAGNPCSLTASIAASDARLYRRICMVCANDCRDSGWLDCILLQ